jgi:HEPN domain-containing protein
MNVPPEVVEILRQWVRKAEHDLEAATRIMRIEDGCPFDTVCFHCRQAAEVRVVVRKLLPQPAIE